MSIVVRLLAVNVHGALSKGGGVIQPLSTILETSPSSPQSAFSRLLRPCFFCFERDVPQSGKRVYKPQSRVSEKLLFWQAKFIVCCGGIPVGMEILSEAHRFALYVMLIDRQPLNAVLTQLDNYHLTPYFNEKAYQLLKEKYGEKQNIIDKFNSSFEMIIVTNDGLQKVMHIDCNTLQKGLSVEYTAYCEEPQRFELAKLSASQNSRETAKSIHLFNLSEDHLVEMGKIFETNDNTNHPG